MAYNLPKLGTISVAGGGTGRTTLTNHGVLVGAATSAITQLSAGTSGQVLQSGGASADPAYSTATYPSTAGTSGNILTSDGTNWTSSASAIQFTQVNMNSTTFKSSNSSPVQLIAAPGSGKIIMVLGWIFKLNYGGTNAFTGTGLPSLQYPSSGTIISTGVATDYTGTTNKKYSYSAFITATGTIENDALNYFTQISDPTGNAAGNNTVSVGVWYNIVTIT